MIRFILNRKILIGLLTVLTLIVGIYSMTKLDAELMPEVDFDGAFVMVNAGDMAAIEVERNITTPIEREILHIDGVEDVSSTTTNGMANIQVMIERGRGEDVTKEIQMAVNNTTANISGITDVIAEQISLSASYEFFMDISGKDMDEMTQFAEEVLEPRLENLREVRDVDLMGIQEYEMIVAFDQEDLAENGLDSSEVISIIQQANTDATVGELTEETEQPALRFETQLASVKEVEDLTIPTQHGLVQVADVADVSIEPLETSSYVWKDGTKDFIFVQVGRAADTTQIEMADAVRGEVEQIRDEGLINGFTLNEVVGQADYVEESISTITQNILIGGIIAMVILILILRSVRATIIIGISIPTSILLTFITMNVLDYSFNMLTLIALGLGIAMMVDSSIVILESIFKQHEQGYSSFESVIKGTKEVSSAVIASMLTTIVVFLPIGLMGGEVGQFMIILSVVVAITLISSVLVAFTIIPALSEKWIKTRKNKKVKEGKLIRVYENFISWVVKKKRHSIAMIALFFLMFVGSFFLLFKVPMTVMPDMMNRYAELMVDLETGVSTEEKNAMVKKMGETLENIEDVESSYITDDGSMFYMMINMTKEENITRDQKAVNEEILSELRVLEKDYPIASVQSALSVSTGQPVQVQVKGEDFDQLQKLAENITEKLEEIDGLVGITNSIERSSIEKVIDFDTETIEEAGLSEVQLRSVIQSSFLDMPISEIKTDDGMIPLVAKWKEEVSTENQLLDHTIPTISGEKRLSSFVDLQTVQVPNEISHLDGERYMTISADIENTDLGTVNRDIQQMISGFDTPDGYTIATGGDIETQQELVYDMVLVLVISIFLVYLVMAVQFNHLAHPIIVMSVIPMAFVGVVLGLFATQRELSMMSGMGIIMLVGIVLNNAILLIDRTKQLRNEGMTANAAIVQASKDRIRPIFMTTFTTAGGMLPLALATGTTGNYQAPMATAIISGLMFATLITLILIPSVYRVFNGIGNGFNKLLKRNKKEEAESDRSPLEVAK